MGKKKNRQQTGRGLSGQFNEAPFLASLQKYTALERSIAAFKAKPSSESEKMTMLNGVLAVFPQIVEEALRVARYGVDSTTKLTSRERNNPAKTLPKTTCDRALETCLPEVEAAIEDAKLEVFTGMLRVFSASKNGRSVRRVRLMKPKSPDFVPAFRRIWLVILKRH